MHRHPAAKKPDIVSFVQPQPTRDQHGSKTKEAAGRGDREKRARTSYGRVIRRFVHSKLDGRVWSQESRRGARRQASLVENPQGVSSWDKWVGVWFVLLRECVPNDLQRQHINRGNNEKAEENAPGLRTPE